MSTPKKDLPGGGAIRLRHQKNSTYLTPLYKNRLRRFEADGRIAGNRGVD
jgi:hypothetical protein